MRLENYISNCTNLLLAPHGGRKVGRSGAGIIDD